MRRFMKIGSWCRILEAFKQARGRMTREDVLVQARTLREKIKEHSGRLNDETISVHPPTNLAPGESHRLWHVTYSYPPYILPFPRGGYREGVDSFAHCGSIACRHFYSHCNTPSDPGPYHHIFSPHTVADSSRYWKLGNSGQQYRRSTAKNHCSSVSGTWTKLHPSGAVQLRDQR